MSPHIKVFSNSDWAFQSAILLQSAIQAVLRNKNKCSVVLTGGRTAARLYEAWAQIFEHQSISGTHFYFGDERCVPFDHIDSNYNMAMKTLFRYGLPSGCSIARIEVENPDSGLAAKLYEKILPGEVDILLIAAGEDGHIASLFPGDSLLKGSDRGVASVVGLCEPFHRITITPKIIHHAKQIFLLATGEKKGAMLGRSLHLPLDVYLLPIQLACRGIWLLDNEAASKI